jgi:GTP pyrophosphokinase
VCAHWHYKEGEREARPYAEKMTWLRQVVERRQGSEGISPLAASVELGDELRQLFRDERIYVYTPKGHVVDLNATATPLDFAYRVHTQIGQRCCGALVDGEPVRLNVELVTGQRVEILTHPASEPSRDWLDLHLGYVRTARARQKLHDWFRSRGPEINEADGRARLELLLARIGRPWPDEACWAAAAARLGYSSTQEVLRALGAADCQVLDVIQAFDTPPGTHSPVPIGEYAPDDELAQLDPAESARDTAQDAAGTIVRIQLEALDRPGLLRDFIKVLGDQGLTLLANTGRVDQDRNLAIISFDVSIAGTRELACLVDALSHVEDVRDARCVPR